MTSRSTYSRALTIPGGPLYSFRERWAALDAAVTLLANQSPPPPAADRHRLRDGVPRLDQRRPSPHHRRPDHLRAGQPVPGSGNPLHWRKSAAHRHAAGHRSPSSPSDSKGFPTSDTLTWSSADDTVVSLQPSADTLSCLVVAGVPGLGVVVTVTDGTISATDSFDVVPGGVATL